MIHVGTSGWSYPSWRGGFYPAGADPKTFLSFYAERFDTVELNTTGYRLPAEEQFERWAEQTPAGFKFAVKMPLTRLDRVGTFVERVRRSVTGSARCGSPSRAPATRAAHVPARLAAAGARRGIRLPPRILGRRRRPPPRQRLRRGAFPLHQAARASLLGGRPARLAERLRPPAYVYFRHEDAPTAPEYALRLLKWSARDHSSE